VHARTTRRNYPMGQSAPYNTVTNVIPPSGVIVVWIRQPPSPLESMVKVPSSSGPDTSVLNVAVSMPAWSHAATASGSLLLTAYRVLDGAAEASSAGDEPGKRGNPTGTASQMRPHAVSVWPTELDAPGCPLTPEEPSTGALGATAGLPLAAVEPDWP